MALNSTPILAWLRAATQLESTSILTAVQAKMAALGVEPIVYTAGVTTVRDWETLNVAMALQDIDSAVTPGDDAALQAIEALAQHGLDLWDLADNVELSSSSSQSSSSPSSTSSSSSSPSSLSSQSSISTSSISTSSSSISTSSISTSSSSDSSSSISTSSNSSSS